MFINIYLTYIIGKNIINVVNIHGIKTHINVVLGNIYYIIIYQLTINLSLNKSFLIIIYNK